MFIAQLYHTFNRRARAIFDDRFATIAEFWQIVTDGVELAQYIYQVQLPAVTSNASSRSLADEKTKHMAIIMVQDMQERPHDTTSESLTRLLLVLILVFFVLVLVLGIHFFR